MNLKKKKIENMALGINNWPKDERPRERLFRYGASALSNAELLAILLSIGYKGKSAVCLARDILVYFKSLRAITQASISDWKSIKGLGIAKVSQIKAALELGRRYCEETFSDEKKVVSSSEDVSSLLMPRMRDLQKEVFVIVFLNAKHCIIDTQKIEEGTVNQAFPIIREVFASAIRNMAVSIICAHNHPSGCVKPSQEDISFTKELVRAGEIMQIRVVDHIVIGDNVFYSFADNGVL